MKAPGIRFEFEDSIVLLSRTPAVLHSLLQGLPEHWATANEGPGTWSAFDVLGHLIHGENTDWIPRLKIILEHGESRSFEPFVRDAMFSFSAERTLAELLYEFARLRALNLEQLRQLWEGEQQLELRGTHPEFGSVSLRQLLATWTAHDLGHIVQISRVLARQYRDEVGPWSAYLSVMG